MCVIGGTGGFPGGSNGKESASNAGDLGSISGSGRFPGERNSNPLQYSSLENPKTEECTRLQSMGTQRVRHDLATKPPPPSTLEMAGWHHQINEHEFEKLQETVKDRKAWHAAVQGVTKSRTQVND